MTAIAHQPHPVTRAVAGVRDQLTSVAAVPLWSMDAAETTAVIGEVQAAEAQLAEVKARLLIHATRTDIAGETAASSTATWHAATTRTTRAAAHRLMRLAEGLEQRESTRTALAAGTLQVEQTEAILRALSDLPDDLDGDVVEEAEQQLLTLAADHDAKHLRILGRRILELVSPQTADAHEAKLLEKEERAAQVATRLTVWDDGHGKLHGRFTIDSALSGSMLKKALFAIASPKHQAAKGPLGERRPTPERLGQAFAEYIQRYPTDRLPETGGLNATVVVFTELDTLMGGLKAAHLDTGEAISPGAARRLACEAGIIPAVLGGDSQVLDLGRKRRFYTNPTHQDHRAAAANRRLRPPGIHMHHPTAGQRSNQPDASSAPGTTTSPRPATT